MPFFYRQISARLSLMLLFAALVTWLTSPLQGQAQAPFDTQLAQRLGPDLDLPLQSGGTVGSVLAEAQENVTFEDATLDALFTAAAGDEAAMALVRVYIGRDVADGRQVFLRAVKLLDAALADPRSADPAIRASAIDRLAAVFQAEMARLLASLGPEAVAPTASTDTQLDRLLALEADFERLIALALASFSPAAGGDLQAVDAVPLTDGQAEFGGGTVSDAFGGPGAGESNGVVVPFEDEESAASPS